MTKSKISDLLLIVLVCSPAIHFVETLIPEPIKEPEHHALEWCFATYAMLDKQNDLFVEELKDAGKHLPIPDVSPVRINLHSFKAYPTFYTPPDMPRRLEHIGNMVRSPNATPLFELYEYILALSKQPPTVPSILLDLIYGLAFVASLVAFCEGFDPDYSWKKRVPSLALGFGALFFGVPFISLFLIAVNNVLHLTVLLIVIVWVWTCYCLVFIIDKIVEKIEERRIEFLNHNLQTETLAPPKLNLGESSENATNLDSKLEGQIMAPAKKTRKPRAKASPSADSPPKKSSAKRAVTKKVKPNAPKNKQAESENSID